MVFKESLNMSCDNVSLPYRIENIAAHGRIVKLGKVADDILSRHDYDEALANLLGEFVALTAIMGSALKFIGRFVVQTKTNGAIPMMVCDIKTDGTIRAYAMKNEEKYAHICNKPSQMDLMGKGYISFTVDQGDNMERYQGIVPLEHDLEEAVHTYFKQSEQIDTCVNLFSSVIEAPNHKKSYRVGAIMLQKTAQHDVKDLSENEEQQIDEDKNIQDDWKRLTALLATVQHDELLDETLEPEVLLYRLFHEDGVRAFEPKELQFGCSCSHERLLTFVKNFTSEEKEDIIKDGTIEIVCEFCNEGYTFHESNW